MIPAMEDSRVCLGACDWNMDDNSGNRFVKKCVQCTGYL